MRAIVLAAGYGTRMYPLTRQQPKALLPIGPRGETVLDYLLAQLGGPELVGGRRAACPTGNVSVERVLIVTNERFAPLFAAAAGERSWPFAVELLSDGTASPEERLGAIGDLALALERTDTDEPALVLGADNVFEVSLATLLETFAKHQATTIAVMREADPARLRRTGVVELSDDGRVLRFEEKPAEPRSQLAVPPLYVFDVESLRAVPRHLAEGHSGDAPGSFIAWLSGQRPVYGAVLEGRRWDIGSMESYEATRRHFGGG